MKWKVIKVNGALTIEDENGCRIAQCSSGKGLPTQQQERIATLIAALPDLLHMLSRAIIAPEDQQRADELMK